jgi:hypothetical protein
MNFSLAENTFKNKQKDYLEKKGKRIIMSFCYISYSTTNIIMYHFFQRISLTKVTTVSLLSIYIDTCINFKNREYYQLKHNVCQNIILELCEQFNYVFLNKGDYSAAILLQFQFQRLARPVNMNVFFVQILFQNNLFDSLTSYFGG